MPPVIAGLVALGGIIAGAFTTSTLIGIGVSLALSGVAKLLRPKASASIASRGTQFNVRQPVSSWRIIYGTVRTAGVFTYIETTGANKEFLHMVLTLAGHEVSAIGNVFFDDRFAQFNPTTGEGIVLWAGVSFIEKKLGTDGQTAFTDLVAKSAGLWTTNHRQRGRACVHLRLTYNADKFPTGIPNITFDVDGKKVEDTRLSPPSEVFSHNPALCIRDYLLDTIYGMGVDPDRIDEDSFIAGANICDEQVNLRTGGSQDRYRLDGVFETSQRPAENIQAMLSSCAGRLIYTNGKYKLFVGAYRTPNPETITENDLRGPIQLETRKSRRDTYNGVKGVFISPSNAWQPSDFPPYQGAGYLAEDQGEEIWQDIELPFTTSRPMAQRLAKIELERSRRQLTLRIPCTLSQYTVAPLDVIQVTNTRFGWTNKTFEVVDVKLGLEEDQGGALIVGVDLICRETDANVYAWDPDTDETIVNSAGVVVLPDPLAVEPVTNLAVASSDTTSIVVDGIRYPRIHATWTAPVDEFVLQGGHLEVYLRVVASPPGIAFRVATLPGDAEEVYIGPGNIEIGEDYEVEVVAVAINSVRAASGYSDPVEVSMTTSGIVIGPANRPYRPLTNPLTAEDVGASATVNIDDWTNRILGLGDFAYDAGAIAGLDFNTLYYIYFDDPTLSGGAVAYFATETKDDILGNPSRFIVGSIVTPQDGGLETEGNGDGGGGGAQGGSTTTIFPDKVVGADDGSGGTSYNDIELIIDGEQNSFGYFTADGIGVDGEASADITFGASSIPNDYTSAILKVDIEVPNNNIASGSPDPVASVLATILSPVSSTSVFSVLEGVTQSRAVFSLVLPKPLNLAMLLVQATAKHELVHVSGSVTLRVYRAWIEIRR